MNIVLSIEQLILYGINLPPGQRALLQDSMEGELRRLLAGGGLAPQWGESGVQPRLSAGEINLPDKGAALDPVRLGLQIAQAVYGGMSR